MSTGLPGGYRFPLGFVSFTFEGITPGATVSVTNILHDSLGIATVIAYGPTPGDSQPHWYELNSTIADDEVRLTFTDGNTGAQDLSAKGSVTTIYGLAYQLPSVPQLRVASATSQTINAVIEDNSGPNPVFLTNIMTLTHAALAWPASATNYNVEFGSGLVETNWSP